MGDRVFVVTAIEDSEQRALLSIERKSGRVVWQKDILKSAFERIHRLNSRASSTPVTDGNSLYLSFLSGDEMWVAAFTMDGELRWKHRPGQFSSKHGYCSSPILWKDKVIINGDHDGDAYSVALNQKMVKRSGRQNDRTRREVTARQLFEISMAGIR